MPGENIGPGDGPVHLRPALQEYGEHPRLRQGSRRAEEHRASITVLHEVVGRSTRATLRMHDRIHGKTPTILSRFTACSRWWLWLMGTTRNPAAPGTRGEKFEVEVSDHYERDVSEDAGRAYIALIDGDRRERAGNWRRPSGRSASDPLWAGRFEPDFRRRGRGPPARTVTSTSQTPASMPGGPGIRPWMTLLPPFLAGWFPMTAKPTSPSPARDTRRPVLPEIPSRPTLLHTGEVFRNDLCNADVELGDLLIHRAWPPAQRYAAKVFGADKPTSSSTDQHLQQGGRQRRPAARGPVLFDRNNHKSLHQGAPVQAGAILIFLPTARNSRHDGAVDWDAWMRPSPGADRANLSNGQQAP